MILSCFPTCHLLTILIFWKVQAEPVTEPEIEEHPLVDLSEPNPDDERDEVHVVLSPEVSGLMVDTPEGNENETVKDAPVAEQAIVTEQKGSVAEEKAEEAEKLEERVSAPGGNGDMRS